jgi:hypothetical protein
MVEGEERMKTFNRICIKDSVVEAANGDRQELKRGREYLTSEQKDGEVTVFSTFWAKFPVDVFAGEVPFTKS